MRSLLLRLAVSLVLVVSAFGCAPMKAAPPPSAPAAPTYGCATCGGSFQSAGNCPKCGVELQMKQAPSSLRGK